MKGILFKPWKIKAIAESSPDFEWQTRRVIKPQPPSYCDSVELLKTGTYNFYKKADPDFHAYLKGKSRFQVGDVVYIKEALRRKCNDPGMPCDYITYVLDDTGVFPLNPKERHPQFGRPSWIWDRDTISPLFMPAWAARYFIKITDVKCERLQDITEEDAMAEGCSPKDTLAYRMQAYPSWNARLRYAELWDSINLKYPWSSNPFVWVYSFKKVNHKED